MIDIKCLIFINIIYKLIIKLNQSSYIKNISGSDIPAILLLIMVIYMDKW